MKLKKSLQVAVAMALVTAAAMPEAQAGGLSSGTSAATTFQIWLYGFLGIGAVIYLGHKGLEAWLDKGHWSDFGYACGKVAVVGSGTVLAPWLWTIFTS